MGIFQQKYITEKEDTTTPEHYLWVSVLSKAAHDAIYTSDWVESKRAIAWFKDMGTGFREVCQFAGRDPLYVHKRIMKKIKEREMHMEMVRTGARLYVKDNEGLPRGGKVYHSHYRGGLGNSKEVIKRRHTNGHKKNLKMVLRGSKGGRPRLYNGL
tara:strand:- start:226 stop:693 length:468 start_codon:yes stop_codon:yes gene_type:complete